MSAPAASQQSVQCLVYARVSKDKTKRGKSVDEQITEGREFCEDQDWSVAKVVRDDSTSASRYATRERKGWETVQRELATGRYGALLVWESSRATRRLDGYVQLRQLCEQHGVLLAYSGDVYDLSKASDRKRTAQDAVDSENESDKTSLRAKRAVRASAKAGKPHGKLLYGYRRRYDEATRAYIGTVLDDEQAAIVREVARRFLASEPLYAIAADLNRRGVPTPEDKGWSLTRLRRLLLNPGYSGQRRWKDQCFPSDVPVLIAPEDHARIVAKLDDPARRTYRQRPDVTHLLSGIARCGKCGAAMYRGKSTRDQRSIYACFDGKSHLVRSQAHVDQFVSNVVVSMLSSPSLVDELTTSADDPDVLAARQQVDQLRTDLDAARAAWKAGRISLDSFADYEADNLRQLDAAQRQARAAAPVSSLVLDVAGEGAAAWWDDVATIEQQRAIVRELMTVTILPTTDRGRGFKPDYVKVERRIR